MSELLWTSDKEEKAETKNGYHNYLFTKKGKGNFIIKKSQITKVNITGTGTNQHHVPTDMMDTISLE